MNLERLLLSKPTPQSAPKPKESIIDDEYKKFLDCSYEPTAKPKTNPFDKNNIFHKQKKFVTKDLPSQKPKSLPKKEVVPVSKPLGDQTKKRMLEMNRNFHTYMNLEDNQKNKLAKQMSPGLNLESSLEQRLQKQLETSKDITAARKLIGDTYQKSSKSEFVKKQQCINNQQVVSNQQCINKLQDRNKKIEEMKRIEQIKRIKLKHQQQKEKTSPLKDQKNQKTQKDKKDTKPQIKQIPTLNQMIQEKKKKDQLTAPFCFDCQKYHLPGQCRAKKAAKQPISQIQPHKIQVQKQIQNDLQGFSDSFEDSYEQDSFIDDTDLIDKEQVLKQVRKVTRYDPTKYKHLDDELSEMDNNDFAALEEEEWYSKRVGRMEDELELKRIKLEEH